MGAGLFGAADDRPRNNRCANGEPRHAQLGLVSSMLLTANLIGRRDGWNPGSHLVC
jgi:hypothetical protein